MSNNTPLKELSISIACLLDEPDTIKVKDIEHLQNLTTKVENFVEEVFELAFGDDAINRDFSFEEVLTKLKEEGEELHNYQENTIVAYDRSQLDDALEEKATDADWVVCQNAIHNNDYAWSAMSDACSNAEEEVSNA